MFITELDKLINWLDYFSISSKEHRMQTEYYDK